MYFNRYESKYDDAKFIQSILNHFALRFGDMAIDLALGMYLGVKGLKVVPIEDDDLPF